MFLISPHSNELKVHIPQDKRAIKSAQKCCDALRELLKTDAFDRITVSQICAVAQISRPTFYRLFDTPVDIIRWHCDCFTKDMCQRLRQQEISVQELPFQFIVFDIFSHPEALELAYKAGRVDVADAVFAENISPLLDEVRRKYQISETDLDLSTTLVSAIITASFRAWINSGKSEPINVLYERVIRIIEHLH